MTFEVNQRSTNRLRTRKSKTRAIPTVKELNLISKQNSLMPFFHHVDKMDNTYIQNHENDIISGSKTESSIYNFSKVTEKFANYIYFVFSKII